MECDCEAAGSETPSERYVVLRALAGVAVWLIFRSAHDERACGYDHHLRAGVAFLENVSRPKRAFLERGERAISP
jgi:hypothetical protein